MGSAHWTRRVLMLVTTIAALPAAWSQTSTEGGDDELGARIEQVSVGVRSDRSWKLPSHGAVEVTQRAVTDAPAPMTSRTCGSEKWSFISSPRFLWVPGVSGDLAVGGLSTDVDESIGDAFDNIFDNFEFASQVRLEARRGRWGIAFNLLYLSLGNEEPVGPGVNIDWDFDMIMPELFALYRFATVPLGCGDACFQPTMTVDALGGLRYVHAETRLANDPGPNAEGTMDIVDPVIGLRVLFQVTRDLTFTVSGDIGGFGVGSELSWQAFAGVEWRVSDRVSLNAGWMILAIDSEKGLSDFDLTMSGPSIGATIRF